MSDTIKRNTGFDLHKAIGGKTAAEIAEERLKKDYENSRGGGGYGGGYNAGGYQGISIPLDGPTSSVNTSSHDTGTYQGIGSESLKKESSKYGHKWGTDTADDKHKKEEKPKEQKKENKLFQGLDGKQKKRLDDDSDEEEEQQQDKVDKGKKEKEVKELEKEVDLLNMDDGAAASGTQQNDLLMLDLNVGAAQSDTTGSLLDMGGPTASAPTQQAPLNAFEFMNNISTAPSQP